MLFFRNDYSEGAHPNVLEALSRTNFHQQVGYGLDDYCKEATQWIYKALETDQVDVHFIPAGTLTNLIALSSFLRPYEAIIATKLGHIAVHETGAIEATGHKVIEMPCVNGLLTPEMIDTAMAEHIDEHMVKPKLVYISNATEMGTIYTKAMLKAIREKCNEHGLYLYMDGARLATALASDDSDLTLKDITDLTDAFYIGGTKMGILFGEALIICNPNLKPYMRYAIKQRGGLLAKGRLLGIQFIELFKDGLYDNLARHTNEMAILLKEGIKALGFKLVAEPSTNLIFTVLPNVIHEELQTLCQYEAEVQHDAHHIEARFVTSWATKEEDVHALLTLLKTLKDKHL